MANPQKRKGDRAELEAAKLLSDLTGYDVVRKLGAGRLEDTGDLYGIPGVVIQVRNYQNVTKAVSTARDDADQQARNMRPPTPFRFGMVRHPGGLWTCVLSPQAMAVWIAEAL